jgi:hypothetical protein
VALLPGWSARTRSEYSSLALALILTTLVPAPTVAWAQRANGLLGVSATVLPPILTHGVELTSFRVERNGVALLETTTPAAGAVSLIVMSTVSSSANGFVPVAQAPALVRPTQRPERPDTPTRTIDSRASRWRYELELGPVPSRSEPHDLSVRISYLIVPGT